MLKIACVDAGALSEFKISGQAEATRIDYSLLAAALNDAVPGTAGSGTIASINTRCVPAGIYIPAALQALYPEQARIIGRQLPNGSSCWHKFIVSFSSNAQNAFFEITVDRAVLNSLAAGAGRAALQDRPVQQYTQGSSPDSGAVFTTGYSVFLQQISQGDGREWLDRVMPLKNGVGIMALRRSGVETRTDTLVIRLDSSGLPQRTSGMPEVLVVAGWER